MSFSHLKQSISQNIKFCKECGISLFIFNIFLGWNGLQFLCYKPTIEFADFFYIRYFYLYLIEYDNNFTPAFIFVIFSVFLFLYYLNIRVAVRLNLMLKNYTPENKCFNCSAYDNEDLALNFFVRSLWSFLKLTITFIAVFTVWHIAFDSINLSTLLSLKIYIALLILHKFFLTDFVMKKYVEIKDYDDSYDWAFKWVTENLIAYSSFWGVKIGLIIFSFVFYNIILKIIIYALDSISYFQADKFAFVTMESFTQLFWNIGILYAIILLLMLLMAPLISILSSFLIFLRQTILFEKEPEVEENVCV